MKKFIAAIIAAAVTVIALSSPPVETTAAAQAVCGRCCTVYGWCWLSGPLYCGTSCICPNGAGGNAC